MQNIADIMGRVEKHLCCKLFKNRGLCIGGLCDFNFFY